MSTTFENQCKILSEVWLGFKEDPTFKDFISYNDLGLPIAYAITNEIIEATPRCVGLVSEAWELLIELLGDGTDAIIAWIDEDGNEEPEDWRSEEFSSLAQVMDYFKNAPSAN